MCYTNLKKLYIIVNYPWNFRLMHLLEIIWKVQIKCNFSLTLCGNFSWIHQFAPKIFAPDNCCLVPLSTHGAVRVNSNEGHVMYSGRRNITCFLAWHHMTFTPWWSAKCATYFSCCYTPFTFEYTKKDVKLNLCCVFKVCVRVLHARTVYSFTGSSLEPSRHSHFRFFQYYSY